MKKKQLNKEIRLRVKIINLITPRFKIKGLEFKRKLLNVLKGKSSSNISYEEKYIDRADGSKLRLCIYTPLERKENVVGLLWFHAGGYALGIPETDEKRIKDLIDVSNAIVIAVDYALSFEAPYPKALNDAYLALKWMNDNVLEYKINKRQLFIGGESAGGGLAAALALYARDNSKIKIAFQMPIYPMLDDRMITKSVNDNKDPIWSSKDNKLAWDYYLRGFDRNSKNIIYAAPARAKDLTNLPPCLSYVGNMDPFLDETIEYINRLKKANVATKFEVFDGACHAFDIVASKAKISKDANDFLIKGFKHAVDNYFT